MPNGKPSTGQELWNRFPNAIYTAKDWSKYGPETRIGAGEEEWILGLIPREADKAGRVEIRICYCSIDDECETATSQGGATTQGDCRHDGKWFRLESEIQQS